MTTRTTTTSPFEYLRQRLRGTAIDFVSNTPLPPPIERAVLAIGLESDASARDRAVLLRHALRYEVAHSGAASLIVPDSHGWPDQAIWKDSNVDAAPVDGGLLIRARPWTPPWLPDVPDDGVDGRAASEQARRSDRTVPGDPFLREFQLTSYRSAGQQAAIRAALDTPPGSTLLVCLPTGEGKSLIFRSIARMGFADNHTGVTVVVTPTVALALDHESVARDQMGFGEGPFAYKADDLEQARILRDRIRSGEQSICFASPESICSGTLRSAIEEAASQGRLRAIVVDEAHLIDSWGINFRPDFQVLAGLRRRLLEATGTFPPFRTILLSATLTADTSRMLQSLFPSAPGSSFGVSSSARLRPEIEYWVTPPSDPSFNHATEGGPERIRRVTEAILNLPRPAIVYTTERWMASDWQKRFRELGFNRIGIVTGDTPAAERRQVLDGWRDKSIDLVVGTSAFGLGIDNPNVRTVIHACVPETLDRFYQEVGRGGRNGVASLSLILPTERDLRTAVSLNRRRLLSVDKARMRWNAMFHDPERKDSGKDSFDLRVTVPPDTTPEYIDMVSARSTGWHMRTLVLMAAAGAITLLNVDKEFVARTVATEDDDGDEAERPRRHRSPGRPTKTNAAERESEREAERRLPRVTVRIEDPTHDSDEFWQQTIEGFRQQQDASAANSLEQLRRLLDSPQAEEPVCVASILAPLYQVPANDIPGMPAIPVADACGGCPGCRRQSNSVFERDIPDPVHPWDSPSLIAPLANLVGLTGQLLVSLEGEWDDPMWRRDLTETLKRLPALGLHMAVAFPGSPIDLASIQAASAPVWFVESDFPINKLPEAPHLLALAPHTRVLEAWFTPRPADQCRIWLVPPEVRHPHRAGQALLDVPPAPHMTITEFVRRIRR